MLRKSLLVVLTLSLLFTNACKKEDENTFVINGIHDMDMSTEVGKLLPIAIEQGTGTQEPITITVTDLPAGIEATVDPAKGTPAFGSLITLKQTAAVAGGTYPFKIVGTSASYSRAYDLNLKVPTLNGWIFDGKIYQRSNFSATDSRISFSSGDHGGSGTTVSFYASMPTADGVYTYKIVENSDADDEVELYTGDQNHSVDRSDNPPLTLKVSGGKYSVSCPTTILYRWGGLFRTIVIDARQ